MREYYVYILANRSRTLYVGVTNNIYVRHDQHLKGQGSEFTAKYRINRLVYVETTDDIYAAIEREKQIKSWTRDKKVALIESVNPTWEDLSEMWRGSAVTPRLSASERMASDLRKSRPDENGSARMSS
jgi:putative endonuclease